ncbi:hypothetical protein LC048_08730 [Mesobacillus subterraneus]|uniref:hypothetical protein n=1 Tax=Mesobacillus subterraneus TaxID=285983 RepID=UPI001CFCEACB|nr:hypothetical protein [Mesobacillus subterraneus]WLR56934.1 hypothetical protein LC048_08730 [Mesobacillus subterraneus]
MAENREKYFWLLWTFATTMVAYFYFSLAFAITFFLSGIIISSKCLVENFINQQDEAEKQSEKNH